MPNLGNNVTQTYSPISSRRTPPCADDISMPKRARHTPQPSTEDKAAAVAKAEAARAAATAAAAAAEAKAKADAAAKTRRLAAQQEEEAKEKAKEAEEAQQAAEQAQAAAAATAAAAAIPKPGQKVCISGIVEIPALNGLFCTVVDPATMNKEPQQGKLMVRLPAHVNGALSKSGQDLSSRVLSLKQINLTSLVSRTPSKPPSAAAATASSSSSSSPASKTAAKTVAKTAAKTAAKTGAKTAKTASGPKVTTRGRAASQGGAAATKPNKTSKASAIGKPGKKAAATRGGAAVTTTPAAQRSSRTLRAVAALSGGLGPGLAPVEDAPRTTRLAARSRAVIEYQGPRRTRRPPANPPPPTRVPCAAPLAPRTLGWARPLADFFSAAEPGPPTRHCDSRAHPLTRTPAHSPRPPTPAVQAPATRWRTCGSSQWATGRTCRVSTTLAPRTTRGARSRCARRRAALVTRPETATPPAGWCACTPSPAHHGGRTRGPHG